MTPRPARSPAGPLKLLTKSIALRRPRTLSKKSNIVRLQRRIDSRQMIVSTLSFCQGSMPVIRNQGGPHDPQGTRRMAWHRPRRQRRPFDRFRRARQDALFVQDPLPEREGYQSRRVDRRRPCRLLHHGSGLPAPDCGFHADVAFDRSRRVARSGRPGLQDQQIGAHSGGRSARPRSGDVRQARGGRREGLSGVQGFERRDHAHQNIEVTGMHGSITLTGCRNRPAAWQQRVCNPAVWTLDRRFPLLGRGMIAIVRAALLGATCLLSMTALAQSAVPPSQPSAPSPSAPPPPSTPPGPDVRVKITDDYATLVARDAYFWAWPMVNLYNRRLDAAQVTKTARSGPTVSAPLNRLGMITDYVDPAERLVACPNQDVVYGLGVLALDISPVVIQVPDFGDRFWVYQAVDLRTDSFVQ